MRRVPLSFLAALLLAPALAALAPVAPARGAVAAPATKAAHAPAAKAARSAHAPKAAPAPAASPALTDSLRLDPTVRTGVLANGLRFYIRANHKPEKRLTLRLVVAVGSTAEADDQRGLAHLCEHMNFDGSEHFKPEELVAYLQSIGLRFGADANAYTSFDQTVYMLEVPTDRDTLLDRGFTALSDFAGRATLTDDQIRKERNVVLEEWRLGRGADERIERKQLPVVYAGSRYAERLPIGLPEIIEHSPDSRIRDFYHEWYTPDRMAVVAVGDIDPARAERLIRAHFGDLKRPANSPPRPLFPIPINAGTLVSSASDSELTRSDVEIEYKRPLRRTLTVRDFRADLVEGLYDEMLNDRLREIGHRADTPFIWGYASSGGLGRTLDTWNLSAFVHDGGIEKGLAALLEEADRVRQHGFLASELERNKADWLVRDERAWAERDKTESPSFAGGYVAGFLDGDPPIGIAERHRLTQALLGGITLDEVNALSARLMPDSGRVVLASAPDKPAAAPPTEAALRATLAKVAQETLPAWHDEVAGRSLMPQPPAPGSIVARRTIPEIGVTVLTLSNGIEAWLKPTDFKADEILFSLDSPGGTSLADSAKFTAADLAETIVGRSGVGGFTQTDLQKLLAGRIASVGSSIQAYGQSIRCSTQPKDLETALQLAYLYFTAPTRDSSSFVALQHAFDAFLAERGNSPEAAFVDTLTAVNTGNFYMDRTPTVAQVDAMKLDDALAFHRRLFANAADFRCFMVGSFSVDSVAPLLARYLGALPSTGHREAAFAPIGPRYPTSVRRVAIRRETEPKASTVITFFTNDGLEELDLHRASSCASILTEHLRQSLRELLGGTYGASASFSTTQPLPGYATMTIEFGCSPARVDTMIDAALAEVRKLRDEGPTAADVAREQEIQRRELEVSLKQNMYWLHSLETMLQLGWDPTRIAHRRERIDALTAKDLQATFRKYFPLDRYTVVSLLPQAGTAAGSR